MNAGEQLYEGRPRRDWEIPRVGQGQEVPVFCKIGVWVDRL